jgi:hypothetical protein
VLSLFTHITISGGIVIGSLTEKEHRLPTIKKVTSGSTPEVADFVDKLYSFIITAGTHKASSTRRGASITSATIARSP